MKQNLKKINIYSNLLNDAVNTFEDFNGVNGGLENFSIVLKGDLAINTFFKSKTIEVSEKISLFEKAVSSSMNAILVEVLKVVIENDDTNSLSELVNKKINIDFNVDKKLIGGLKIKVDDTLYDSSLQTKLENAKSKLVGV